MNVSKKNLGILFGISKEVEAAVIERELCTTFKDADARTTKRVVDSRDDVHRVIHEL